MGNNFAALGSGTEFRARPFGSKANFDARRFSGDDSRSLIGTRDNFDGSCSDTDGVAHAYEDPSKHTDTSDEKLKEGRCALVESYSHRIEIKFEENSRSAFVMFYFAGVVGDAVLMRMERGRTRCNVSCWHNMQEILVGDEIFFWSVEIRGKMTGEHTFICSLKRIIERLYNFGKVRTKREFSDNMRKVHFYLSLSVNLEKESMSNTYGCGPHVRNSHNHGQEW